MKTSSSNTCKKVITYIKAIENQYFESFINEGQVCMNTLKWFRNYEEKDTNIGDQYEGVKMACGKDFKISVGAQIESYSSKEELRSKLNATKWTEIGEGVDLKFFDDNVNANIFSLYAINSSILTDKLGCYLVSGKFIDEFSNHRFVIFLDPEAFRSRMNNAISKLGKTMKYGMIRYYKLDDKLVKDLSYFHKPDKFSYQNEFRIVFEDNKAERKIFNIGPLDDICIEINVKNKYIFERIDSKYINIKMIK